MPDRREIATMFIKALTTDEDADALASVLDEEVLSVSALGRQTGKDAVLTALKNPMLKPLLAQGEWAEPVEDGDALDLRCNLPAGAMLSAVIARLVFGDDGRVVRIEQSIVQAA